MLNNPPGGLFDEKDRECYSIPVKQGMLDYCPSFLNEKESHRLMDQLIQEITWKTETIRIFGKSLLSPRLTAWYGEPGAQYAYSGIQHVPEPFTETLLELRQRISHASGCEFNGVLLNWYRTGSDSMGWHSDDESELGKNPVVASLSLGQARSFRFRRKDNHSESFKLLLENGSLLIMGGELQHFWQHALPKSSQSMQPRINLTFRYIHPV